MSNGDRRKSHIVRIYKDDDPDSDQWVDIQRLDELTFESGSGTQYRKKVWKFDWDNFEVGKPGVDTKQIVDPNNENNFIDVPIRTSVFVHEARGGQYQGRKFFYLNTDSNETRQTHSRRVYHHRIEEDDPPSDPDEYLNALGRQDIGQYIDVELVEYFRTDENEHNTAQGQPKRGAWQDKRWGVNLNDGDPLLKDPILDTDAADPDFTVTLNPDDGPIVDPPWRLDPLQNIVNISWGGAPIFVIGDVSCLSVRVRPRKSDDDEVEVTALGPMSFGAGGSIMGSSFHETTTGRVFLLCGYHFATGPSNKTGIIMASRDGLEWQLAKSWPNNQSGTILSSTQFQGIVWDGDKFYAAGHMTNEYLAERDDDVVYIAKQEEIDTLWSSMDGFSWAEDGRRTATVLTSDGFDVNSDYPGLPIKGLFEPHCSSRVRDGLGNGVPDGVYYYKETSEGNSLFIRPGDVPAIDYRGGGLGYSSTASSTVGIEITVGDETTTIITSPGIPVNAVAYVDGIIVAVGGGTWSGDPDARQPVSFAVSKDMGETWETLSYDGHPPALTIVGATPT